MFFFRFELNRINLHSKVEIEQEIKFFTAALSIECGKRRRAHSTLYAVRVFMHMLNMFLLYVIVCFLFAGSYWRVPAAEHTASSA